METEKNDLSGAAIDILLGRHVKKIREEAGVTEEVVADALNLSVEDYRRCETGARAIYPEMIVILSQVIGVPVVSLYRAMEAALGDGESHKIANRDEIAELLYYFSGVASPLARRKVIAAARSASSVLAVPSARVR